MELRKSASRLYCTGRYNVGTVGMAIFFPPPVIVRNRREASSLYPRQARKSAPGFRYPAQTSTLRRIILCHASTRRSSLAQLQRVYRVHQPPLPMTTHGTSIRRLGSAIFHQMSSFRRWATTSGG